MENAIRLVETLEAAIMVTDDTEFLGKAFVLARDAVQASRNMVLARRLGCVAQKLITMRR